MDKALGLNSLKEDIQMAKKHKRCSILGKCKYKPQWDLAKSFSKDVEPLKSSFVACENIKCHSYLENQFEKSSNAYDKVA